MNFYQKINRFERLNSLNERATTKTLHVSLNFSPTEKPTDNNLIEIVSMYIDKISFGEQPFLIYKHEDAGHPHIYIWAQPSKKMEVELIRLTLAESFLKPKQSTNEAVQTFYIEQGKYITFKKTFNLMNGRL